MTVKAILDTDILSDHGVFTFTSVTVYEIVYGFELKGASSQLKKVMVKQNEEITPIDADYFAGGRHQGNGKKAKLCGRTPIA